MAVNFNLQETQKTYKTLSADEMQQLQQMRTAKQANSTYSGFSTEGSNLVQGGISKSSSSLPQDLDVGDGKASISNVKNLITGAHKATDAQQSQTENYDDNMNKYMSNIGNSQAAMQQEIGNLETSMSTVQNLTERQEQIGEWTEAQIPIIEDTGKKIEGLQTDGLNLASQYGEFDSLDKAMEFMQNEFNADQLQELQEKKAEKEKKEAELQNLPKDDPKRQELESEIDTLNGDIDSLSTSKNGFDMEELSQNITQLGEITSQVNQLNGVLEQKQEELNTNIAESNAISEAGATEEEKIDGSTASIESSEENVNEMQTEADEESENQESWTKTTHDVGQKVTTVSGVIKLIGRGLQATPNPGAQTVGTNMVLIGNIGTIAGNATKMVADVGDAVINKDASKLIDIGADALGIGAGGLGVASGAAGASEKLQTVSKVVSASSLAVNVSLAGAKMLSKKQSA